MEDGASHSTALGSITSLGGGDVCLDLSWENGLKLLNQLTTKLLQISTQKYFIIERFTCYMK